MQLIQPVVKLYNMSQVPLCFQKMHAMQLSKQKRAIREFSSPKMLATQTIHAAVLAPLYIATPCFPATVDRA
jgi:hypothetical protein